MSSHFAKPENALRKGKDLVKVGKPSSALKTLHNILVARRYRLWSPTHEKIMFFYIELAVDLRRNVKDAFVQYRMICQQAQSGSMEKVMKHYQKLAEAKAAEAQQKASDAAAAMEAGKPQGEQAADTVATVEDLEEESPESIMLAAMSGEGTKERLDRQILTPWVKYLWECYRTILDVLRNNAKLEQLYHATARAAFDFCKRFQRNMEFRRLCEILRSHLFSVTRFQNQTNAVDLNSAETQTLYLETRFQQLRMAADLELWQEAYRTIEDIHENMRLGTRVEPPPELMKTYYEKLSQIFWASSNYLFHAYSLHKYYELSAQEAHLAAKDAAVVEAAGGAAPPLNAAQRSNLASAVVLSALIISGGKQTDLHDIDAITGVEHEGNMRLAQLLGFKKESPSRQRILQAVHASGVLNDASDVSKQIFRLLESQFGPLTLYAQLKPLLESLRADADLAKYVAPLEQLTVIRVLQQLSTVFKSMKIAKFMTLVPDIGSIFALERLIMSAISSDLLQLRFDHRTMTLIFPDADLEHPKLRDQLVNLSRNFISLAHTLDAAAASPATQADKIKERTHVFKLIQANLIDEHENVFLRQELIEKRKQELEKMLIDKEKREADAKLAAFNARKAEEQRRLVEESTRREAERKRKEDADRELRAKQAMAEEMKKKIDAAAAASSIQGKTALKAEKKIQALTQDLENIDKIQLLRAQEEILRAQQREVERRRKESSRRIDYTVRAMRLEERALLLAKMESSKLEEAEQNEADFAKYLEQDRLNHAKAVAEKERLIARMSREKNVFHEKLMARRTELFQAEKAKQDERLAVKAEKRRVAEERRRKEEEQREQERAKQAEIERLQRLEEERQEELAAIARKAKEAERQQKLREQQEAAAKANEIVQARLKREEEAEAKEQARRNQGRGDFGAARAGPGAAAGGWGRPSAGGQDERSFRREERPERDFGAMRRGGDEEPRGEQQQERRPERDFGDVRRGAGPAAGAEAERPRWGAPRDGPRDAPRDAPRGGFDRPMGGRFGDDRREAPRDGGRFGGERDAPRDGGRFGGDRSEAPREERNFRAAGGDREPPSRDAFGSRGGQDARPAGGFGRGPERDFGAMRSGPGPQQQQGGAFNRDAPRDTRDFRRREDAPTTNAPQQQQQESSPPAASEGGADDGFTTVKKPARR